MRTDRQRAGKTDSPLALSSVPESPGAVSNSLVDRLELQLKCASDRWTGVYRCTVAESAHKQEGCEKKTEKPKKSACLSPG